MEFTKKELYIIERTFDGILSDNFKAIGQILNTINQVQNTEIKKIAEEYTTNILPNNMKFVDTVKTICVKCEKIRLGEQK